MGFLQSPPVIMPQEHIIHVTHITSKAQVLLHVTVQPAQIEIGEVLRGQAADRQADSQFAAVSRDDPIQEFQEPAILESTFQKMQSAWHAARCRSICVHQVSGTIRYAW